MIKRLSLSDQSSEIKEENSLPHPDSNLDDILFNSQFNKLILKIRNSMGITKGAKQCHTLADILTLTHEDLQQLKGIGEKYISLWDELVDLYSNNHQPYQTSKEPSLIDEKQFDLSEIAINYSSLDKLEKKNLAKFLRIKKSNSISMLLRWSPNDTQNQKGTGKSFTDSMLSLKSKITNELNKISKGEINPENMESELLISTKPIKRPIEMVGDILLEDIDNFLDLIPEEDQDIFQCRWGFVEEERTLEELGEKYNVTRERIRQKEKLINQDFLKHLRLTKENILLSLEDNITPQLYARIENLSMCFSDEKRFYEFLGFVTGRIDLYETIRPTVSKTILNDFFAQNALSCSLTEVKAYIETHHGTLVPENVLAQLRDLKVIRIEGNQVKPLCLSKHEAVACALNGHPKGLPWEDITSIVNTRSLSRTNLNEKRIDPSGFHDSELVYLAGKGIYKNTKYIPFLEINLEQIFDVLYMLFENFGRETAHLNELYKNSQYLQKQDYYVIRYIIKMFGEDYGIYFDGKSQSDTVSLQKEFKRITQRDVIIQAMTEYKKPMTKGEIAVLLKSKSRNHAAYYLDGMMYEGLVVQVDRMLYTTPEIAYSNTELSLYEREIQFILESEFRPVDPSVFQKALNAKLGETYSKYFYSSVAKYCSIKNNWYRQHNLYSINEINYKNLTDVISAHCSIDRSIEENVETLKNFVAITTDSAKTSITNWQVKEMNRSKD